MCRTNISVKWFKINKWITNKRHLYTKQERERKNTTRRKNTGCLHRTRFVCTLTGKHFILHILHNRSIASFVFSSFSFHFFPQFIDCFYYSAFQSCYFFRFYFYVIFFLGMVDVADVVDDERDCCGCLYGHIKEENSIKYHAQLNKPTAFFLLQKTKNQIRIQGVLLFHHILCDSMVLWLVGNIVNIAQFKQLKKLSGKCECDVYTYTLKNGAEMGSRMDCGREKIQKLTELSIQLSVSILIQTHLQQQQNWCITQLCPYIEKYFRLFVWINSRVYIQSAAMRCLSSEML